MALLYLYACWSHLSDLRNVSKSYFIIFIGIPGTYQSIWHIVASPCVLTGWLEANEWTVTLILSNPPISSSYHSYQSSQVTYISSSSPSKKHYTSHLFFNSFPLPAFNSYSTTSGKFLLITSIFSFHPCEPYPYPIASTNIDRLNLVAWGKGRQFDNN